jgi:hypothetical protein
MGKKNAVQQENTTLLFRENLQLLFSVSVLLCNNTDDDDDDDDDESANVLRETLRKKFLEDMAKYYEQKNRVFLDE